MRRAAACLLFICACASAVSATVLIAIEFRELVRSASVIVRGIVVDVQPVWIDGRRSVETFLTIEPREYLKGDLGSRVTVRVPGGQIGRYRTVFVGAPVFQEGDDVVLFLDRIGGSVPWIVGLSQGAFRVVDDPRGGRIVTSPIVMGKPGDGADPVVRGDVRRRPLSVDAFRDAVRQAMLQDRSAQRPPPQRAPLRWTRRRDGR